MAILYNERLFKNIFSNYNTFKEWYSATALSDNELDCPSEKTFTLIAYEYNDCHSKYSPDSFREHFAIDLYTYYKEFEKTTKAIDDLMDLTDEDISLADSVINNIADIPEEESSTNAEEVDFISQQTKMLNKKGKLQVKRDQLANKRNYTVKNFLKRFKHLFITVLSPAYEFVVKEPDREEY